MEDFDLFSAKTVIDCDFESQSICNYEVDDNNIPAWAWQAGPTPAYKTGPKYDHTLNSKDGHYMYVASRLSSRVERFKSHLTSPLATRTSDAQCLQFYYHMYGHDIGWLNVYLLNATQTVANGQLGSPLWSRAFDQGNQWLEGQVTLHPPPSFKVCLRKLLASTLFASFKRYYCGQLSM